MNAIKYILFLFLIGFIGCSIYIAVQPNSFELKKNTISINAPISVVYDKLNNAENWKSWSPLNKKIETVQTLEATSNVSIKQIIEFEDFPTAEITWKLTPKTNETTTVTCFISIVELPLNYKISRVFSNSINKKTAVELKKGLKKLERSAIASMQEYKIKVNGFEYYCDGYYLYYNSSSSIDKLYAKTKSILPKLINYAKSNNIEMAGKPFILYRKINKEKKWVDFSYCVPTTEEVTVSDGKFLAGKFDGFYVLKTTLKGDIKYMKEAWRIANKYVRDNYIEEYDPEIRIEKFIVDSSNSPNPANWISEIYIGIIK